MIFKHYPENIRITCLFPAPVPTPPTSVRTTETPGSDHGTTIRVNVPSQTSGRSEHGSDKRRDSTSTVCVIICQTKCSCIKYTYVCRTTK